MSDTPPSIGLQILARDEAERLPDLLASIELAYDQVVLIDTGSKDKTVAVFEEWAAAEQARLEDARGKGLVPIHPFATWKVAHFDAPRHGLDDFSAARNFADEQLDTEWRSWADCDDIIVGAGHLRGLAAQAPAEIGGYVMGYNYAQDPLGNCLSYLRRERLVRASMAPGWTNWVHEAQALEAPMQGVPKDICEWVHRKPVTSEEAEAGVSASNKRNLRILRAWHKAEPVNPRVLAYLGTETALGGHHKAALPWYRRFRKLAGGWDEERAQVHRKEAMSLMALERYPQARALALEALDVMPSWPDSYLTLAEACASMGEPAKAIEWADEVLRRGAPETLLILNELDYTYQPLKIKAGCLVDVGQLDEGLAVGRQALELVPYDPMLRQAMVRWQKKAKREHTAATWASGAEMLIRHDEPLKAREMIGTVPHYAEDHPRVIGVRQMLRQRLAFIDDDDAYSSFYEAGGAQAEQPVGDDELDERAGALPRARFLLAGVRDQFDLEPEEAPA